MPDHRLHGIIPPVVLPLDTDGLIDEESLERHIGHLLEAGVHGLWMNGSTGEFHALDVEQRAQAVRLAVKICAGAVPVIAHVGDTATTRALEHARAATKAGADLVAVIPPYYVDFTERELVSHFRQIADAVAGPVILYHLPQLAPNGLGTSAIVELARDGVVAGVKDSSSDMVWFRRLLGEAKSAGVELACFTGGSSVTDLGLYLGGAGAMPSTANLTPRHLVAMYDAAKAGDWARVRRMQDELEHLLRALRLPGRSATWSATVAIHKHVLAQLGHIRTDVAAPPLTPLDAEEKRVLASKAIPIIEQLEGRNQR